MSHFTLTVKVGKDRLNKHAGDLKEALDEMLEPYNEQPEPHSRFLVFEDKEAELREEWSTKTVERVQMSSGDLVSPYDGRFREPGVFGRLNPPADLPRVQVPFKQIYPVFDDFVTDYHGYEKDRKTGHYGARRNPNAKWDWWIVGGRWHGFYPVKSGVDIRDRLGESGAFSNASNAGKVDVVHPNEIDLDVVSTETRARIDTFWSEWQALLAGKKFDFWDGPRSKAIDLGLLTVVQGPAEPTATTQVISWSRDVRPDDPRRLWNDVARLITAEELWRDHLAAFNPLVTFAALDDEGWHAPGRMGWFGWSTETPESHSAWCKGFMGRFIHEAKADDTLVLVDCHI